MAKLSAEEWQAFAEAHAFVGNSLLKPMTQTAPAGIDPAFWEAFPAFEDAGVAAAAAACGRAAAAIAECAGSAEAAIERVAVEYTHLFVGPPSPAAPPWETFYRGGEAGSATVGFGEATFEMRRLLREAGLELRNENRQYEDHLGIELLYLSELCRRQAQEVGECGEGDAEPAESRAVEPAAPAAPAVCVFIEQHPLAWIDALRTRVAQERPDGYFAPLLALERELLMLQRNFLEGVR